MLMKSSLLVGVDVAAELGAAIIDYLMMATDEGIHKMAEAKVIGNLPVALPPVWWKTYLIVHKMLESWYITLTTDSNQALVRP